MNTAPVATFDPAQITCVIGGIIIEGFAADSFITIARNNAMFEPMTGVDGLTARAKKNDKTAKITLVLMQTSPSNDYLSGLYLADELSSAGLFSVTIKDNFGTTIAFASEAWIPKPADIAYGASIGERSWEIDTGDCDMFTGGAA